MIKKTNMLTLQQSENVKCFSLQFPQFVLFWFLVPVVSKEDGCYASMKVTKQSQQNDGTLPQGTCNEGNGGDN